MDSRETWAVSGLAKPSTFVAGLDPGHAPDAIFINTPLKDYDHLERYNDYTLPVMGMGYIATVAHRGALRVGCHRTRQCSKHRG